MQEYSPIFPSPLCVYYPKSALHHTMCSINRYTTNGEHCLSVLHSYVYKVHTDVTNSYMSSRIRKFIKTKPVTQDYINSIVRWHIHTYIQCTHTHNSDLVRARFVAYCCLIETLLKRNFRGMLSINANYVHYIYSDKLFTLGNIIPLCRKSITRYVSFGIL